MKLTNKINKIKFKRHSWTKVLFINRTFIVISTCVISTSLFGSTWNLTLNTAINLALKNNIKIQNATSEVEISKQRKKEAFSTALPVISIFGQMNHNFSTATQPMTFPIPFGVLDDEGNPVPLPEDNLLQMTGIKYVPLDLSFGSDNLMVYGINLTQTLFDGRVIAGIRGANSYTNIAKHGVSVARIQVVEQTKKAYFQALLSNKMLEVMEQSMISMEQNLQNVSSLYSQGKVAEFDVIRADVQVANQKTQLTNARKFNTIALISLKRVCGIDIEAPITILGDFTNQKEMSETLIQLKEKLLLNQPLLKQLSSTNQMMKENILLAKSEFMPSVSFSALIQNQQSFNSDGYISSNFQESSSISLGFNFPIFNGFGSSSRLKKARIDYHKSMNEKNDILENLLMELTTIYEIIEDAKTNIEAGIKGVKQAKKAVDMVQKLYLQGKSNQLEILDAQSASDQAELALYQSYYEYNIALASLSRALGEE